MATRRDLTDSQKDLAAIVEDAAEEGTSQAIMLARKQDREEERERHHHTGLTPAPVSAAESTDRMIRGISKEVFDAEIKGHKLNCMEPGGGLREVGNKVDKILEVMSDQRGANRVWKIVGGAAWAVGLSVMGLTINHYAAKRSEESSKRQAMVEDVVVRKLQKIEEVAKSMAPPDPITSSKASR